MDRDKPLFIGRVHFQSDETSSVVSCCTFFLHNHIKVTLLFHWFLVLMDHGSPTIKKKIKKKSEVDVSWKGSDERGHRLCSHQSSINICIDLLLSSSSTKHSSSWYSLRRDLQQWIVYNNVERTCSLMLMSLAAPVSSVAGLCPE